jgi:hypothetical protein
MPFKELFALVAAAATWGHMWQGKKINFRCDCQPVVAAISSSSSPVPEMMHLLRQLATLACTHGFAFRCTHIPGDDNVIADLLSRSSDTQALLARFPFLSPRPTQMGGVSLPPRRPLPQQQQQ